jgi:glucose-1-phosphate cytidylyltransferase
MGEKLMKVVLLAGGLGTRISEYTDTIPKPMVSVGGKPLLWHIMKTYEKYDFKDFYIALGYKADVIKKYFLNYHTVNSDFTVDLSSGVIQPHQTNSEDWKITLVDTGDLTMTGGRIKRLKSFIGNETFMVTYGDGLSNINITELLKFHKSHGKMVTITAVHPSARFGELEIDGKIVKKFKEKPQMHEGWINGGYFVIEPEFFDFISGDQTLLEREPLEKASMLGELMAYQHEGFWQCMDTKRDHELLESLWEKDAPWK